MFNIFSVYSNPERPTILDPTQARKLFAAAEENRTKDGKLTADEVADIVTAFDLDGNFYLSNGGGVMV